ncbi:hypothetical protein MMPV_009598 [Pyropia vietnamensis]
MATATALASSRLATTSPATTITLKGSTALVTEFFHYAVNSVLFQRGIYPPETFTRVAKYGLTMLVTTEAALTDYLSATLGQVAEWLGRGELQALVLAIASVETGAVVERWVFDVEASDDGAEGGRGATAAGGGGGIKTPKEEKAVTAEIQAIVRQITASITFLPLLEDACTFDLIFYVSAAAATPDECEESGGRCVVNAQQVRLRSFDTGVHRVHTLVAYARQEE